MQRVLRAFFGAHGQVALGIICFVIGLAWWIFIEWRYAGKVKEDPLVAAIFRVSMFFGLVACYSIVATGLGYRATERVESAVVEQTDKVERATNVGQADTVEHADKVRDDG